MSETKQPKCGVTYKSTNVTIDSINDMFDFLYKRKEKLSEFQYDDMTTAIIDYLNLDKCKHCGRFNDPYDEF